METNRKNQKNSTGFKILILQHPDEAKRPNGTANLVLETYPNTKLRRGHAWSNLNKAWGLDSKGSLTPSHWAVLFAGGRGDLAAAAAMETPGFYEVSKADGVSALDPDLRFEGVVLIDGTWKEAKSMWWRNSWLLRLKRLVLVEEPASDIRLRRSAQKTALTTVECAAYALRYLSGNPGAENRLLERFREMATSVAPSPLRPPSPELPPTHPTP